MKEKKERARRVNESWTRTKPIMWIEEIEGFAIIDASADS